MKRDHTKTVKQEVIPPKVVMMAKAILHADAHLQNLVLVHARSTGREWAYELARNWN